MKLSVLLLSVTFLNVLAVDSYSQNTRLNLDLNETPLQTVLNTIENQSEFFFLYSSKMIDVSQKVNVHAEGKLVTEILDDVLANTNIKYAVKDRQILLAGEETALVASLQQQIVSGKVTDSQTGEAMPGVNVLIKGTTIGSNTDIKGEYSINLSNNNDVLVFSFIGYASQEIPVAGKTVINVALESELTGLNEVIVIGYGTAKKGDLTGSVVRANIESFRESPNVSVVQSLQGSIPGLNVGQINRAGEEPDMFIRGLNSISGETSPLIIVDNVIFRGNLIDLNPNDIASVDILKDASSAAIYGSQASNGVILITTTKSGGIDGKPVFNYTNYFSFQSPVKELRPGTPADYIKKTEESDIYNSRTAASGYLELNPLWNPSGKFKTSDEIDAYNDGRSTDWFDLLTNDNIYTKNHNISLANSTKYNNYLVSFGITDQQGYLLNEDYTRLNARINLDNNITDWLQIGIQTFMTSSDYSGQDASANNRYLSPYATAYNASNELVLLTGGNTVNPLIQADADDLDKRLNIFGNVYANFKIPFIKGLSYKVNYSNNYRTTSAYYFREYDSNFQGQGSKRETLNNGWSADNIVSYKRVFNNSHNVDITLVYGVEKIRQSYTAATSSVFSSFLLGYNQLQLGSAELQQASSGAWEEASLYNMGRFTYGYKGRYLFTGTVRRDGFSGFSEKNKFGIFPSMSAAWVISEEPFMADRIQWLDQLKMRLSYGSTGNRTVGRYQTLATVSGGYNYITAAGSSIYTTSISSLASPNLKWETTTGVNFGLDFGLFSRKISGTIDYYDSNTTDLLYNVDLPAISRFQKFPDNLGKLHNQGLEISLSSVNIKNPDFEWSSSFTFSRNRNSLKELLGFDLNNDGKEDDLISEGLFIGQPLDAIYTYQIDGKWQVGDVYPVGNDLGANKVVDINNDGVIDTDDKSIIGYRNPSYRFSITNTMLYKNFSLRFFINSVQGGKNYYMSEDDILGLQIMNQENHFNVNFPAGIDYWTPENPNAQYQRPNINVSAGISGSGYSQRNFTRLQDISLSYDFSENLLSRFHIQNLKVYMSGKNLLTLTKWNGWDPETGERITRNGRPVLKSYTIGIDVKF